MKLIRHIVLLKWKKTASKAQVDRLIEGINRIYDECPMVYNFCTSHGVSRPGSTMASSPDEDFDFNVCLDLRSEEEFMEYFLHPYPRSVVASAHEILDPARSTASNMFVEGEAQRVRSEFQPE